MKTTAEMRTQIRNTVNAYPGELAEVGYLLDDFDDVVKQLEDARDRLQKMELELGSIRGQMPGGEL